MIDASDQIYGLLPADWQLVNIGELIADGKADLQTGPFGTALQASEYKTVGTPVIAVKHIGQNKILHDDDLPRVDAETHQRLSRYELRLNDIVFGRKGAVDRRGRITEQEDGWLQGSDCIRLRITAPEIDPVYVSYVLGSLQYQSWIIRNAGGSTMPSLNQSILSRVPLPIPPLEEQHAIAHILGSLDDKIELNRQMNATLEATARAIFKSWFVDFDPVHAKANGEQPVGMDAEIAALFPNSFEDSELGLIPARWKAATMADVAEINSWSLSKKDELDLIEYIEISEVNRGEIGRIQFYERGDEPSRARRRLRHGDTVLSTVRPDRQAYFLCLNPSENLIASTGFAVFTPTTIPWSYVYLALVRPEVFERLGLLADGAAYPAVAPEVIAQEIIYLPDKEALLSCFHTICASLLKKIAENRKESQALAELRDALLPRLISGQIRVGEAEDMTEAHS